MYVCLCIQSSTLPNSPFLFSLLAEGIKMTKITNLLTTKTTKNNKSTQQFVSHYGSFMSKVCSHTFYKLKIKKINEDVRLYVTTKSVCMCVV